MTRFPRTIAATVGLGAVALAMTAWMASTRAQDRGKTTPHAPPPQVNASQSTDWPLHNLDVRNTRYSPLDQINATNAGTLAQAWTFNAGEPIREITPLVVGGVMYVNAGSRLLALNAMTGKPFWTFELEPAFKGGGRGPGYGEGTVYAFGPTKVYAVDAKVGRLVETFGDKGVLSIVNQALEFKYPGKYPKTVDPLSLGYSMTNPPMYDNGTLYIGVPFSDMHQPGGLMVAADARTGGIKWVFNTIPQGPQDEGWEIARDTWGTGQRAGGGVWTTPAIDRELGLIFFNATNPSPAFDGSPRIGSNLFTNSTIALHLATGKLAWYRQHIHHDIWDWDITTPPVLFDAKAGDTMVKGIGVPGKTCYLYMFHRDSGKPINPIVETPVVTKTDVPGEQPWPTQPIPYTARNVPQTPFCFTHPPVTDPELARRVRPMFHPYLVNELVITSPGNTGGSNYGGVSFSPRTGLLYVYGKNDAFSIRIHPQGDSEKPGPGNLAFFNGIAERGAIGFTPTGSLSAYNPVTGQQVWMTDAPAITSAGNVVTAGDVVFQGFGMNLYGFDARNGKELFRSTLNSTIGASPITYRVNGTQYVAVVGAATVYAWALP